jgi:hypothetical protein
MAAPPPGRSVCAMHEEFAAIWLFDDERVMHVGDAALREDALHLLDVVPGDAPDWAAPLDAVEDVRMASVDRDLGGLKTVVLQLSGGGRVRILALGDGATSELGTLLTSSVQPRSLAD